MVKSQLNETELFYLHQRVGIGMRPKKQWRQNLSRTITNTHSQKAATEFKEYEVLKSEYQLELVCEVSRKTSEVIKKTMELFGLEDTNPGLCGIFA